MTTEPAPGELLDRVQSLSGAVDELHDPQARELAQELVAAVIAMYGDGLQRIVDVIAGSREAGASILDQLSQDGAVASLLLIHDLYPVPLAERVHEALDTVRPYMESHGGSVELLGIEDGIAKLALRGSCDGCAASRATLELAIKQALDEHAPDLVGLEVSGVAEPGSGGDPLPAGWISLANLDDVPVGELRTITVDRVRIVLANVDGSLLAYRDRCASCGSALADAELDGHVLRCRSCMVAFDLPRAGRAAGGEPLQLTPVPLLAAGGLRVAA